MSKVEQRGKFIKEKDLFGLFDLFFINEKGGIGLVQVTCNNPHTHYRFQNFQTRFRKSLKHVQIMQFVWVDYKGFIIYTYKDGNRTREKTY